MDERRLTKAEKNHYQIRPIIEGFWVGTCPTCGEVFAANHMSISQASVVHTIRQHEGRCHPVDVQPDQPTVDLVLGIVNSPFDGVVVDQITGMRISVRHTSTGVVIQKLPKTDDPA